MNKTWLDSLGGRKFILTVIVITVGTAVQLLAPGGCNPSYASLLIGITAAFNAANSIVTTSTFMKGNQTDVTESKP